MTTLSEIEARLKACADELEAEINARAVGEWPRRIKRDLATVEEARAAIASVVPLARRAMEMEWKPISTAPTDGAWILGWAEKGSPPYRISWGRTHDNRLAWCTAFGSFRDGYITHWMPLPSPPTSTEEKGP